LIQLRGGRVDRDNGAPMAPTNPDDILRPETSPSKRRLFKDPAYRATSRQPLRLQLPAEPIAPSVARHRVRHWLTAWCWPAGQLEDIVLAVSEAISNSIEHAYPDGQSAEVVDIHGEVEAAPGGQRRVMVIVRDHGRLRPSPIDDENRRRGIPLMRACVDTVTIGQPDDDGAGTSVVLRSRAVPPVLRALGALENDGDEESC
jgi:anti-sigma regulatory factor (Ser/Thr protein kinase)